MRTLLTTSAWVRRFRTVIDDYGNQVRGSTVDTPVQCRITPVSVGASSEDREDRDQVTWLYKVFVSGDTDVRHDDQIIVEVDVYQRSDGSGDTVFQDLVLEVVGAPMLRFDRQGRVHHIEVTCRRVEG
jgi:hypothetical protein